MSLASVPETETEEREPEAQLELEGFQGHKVTELRLNFSGNTLVGDPDTAAALRLDGEVELVVTGRVVSSTHRAGRDAGGTKVGQSVAVFVENVELAE